MIIYYYIINQVNMFHFTVIKFTAEYSKEEVNFLDVNIKLIDGELKRNLVKEKETFWQHRLKTIYPIGLNEKEEYLY